MDGGDWVLLAGLVGGGGFAYVMINRFALGAVFVPPMHGWVRRVGQAGAALLAVGFVGLAVLWLGTAPGKVDQIEGRDHVREVDAVWQVLPVAAVLVGAVAVTVAITVGRRRLPSGHPAWPDGEPV